jgi:hypothetical protein
MIAVMAVHNLSQPCADVGNQLVHSAAQFSLKRRSEGAEIKAEPRSADIDITS